MLQRMEMKDFDIVYSLMKNSFLYDEYRSYNEQKELLNNPKYTVYILPNDEGGIKAFISVFHFDGFAFIEHFAVDPNHRNQGIGSVVLKALKSILRCQICLEVELPETELAKRRISFYERNHFYLNNYPYVQPPFSDDKCSIPLLVMTTDHAISVTEFEQIKTVLFREVYQVHEGSKK